ncbi:MAG: NYN domain-containing protein [Streptosporangiales bacterium]|nr:NYN domain-containing protein [Streptosporangiales bacterium]
MAGFANNYTAFAAVEQKSRGCGHHGVRYFTARVRDDPAAELRQENHLDALTVQCGRLRIHQGRFQRKSRQCRACAASWSDYEEKESDVSFAVSLVEDAARNLFDTALLITADSDMCPAVRAVKRLRPRARVVVAPPPNRRSLALQELCDATFVIGLDKVRRAQSPEVVEVGGRKVVRPAHWA